MIEREEITQIAIEVAHIEEAEHNRLRKKAWKRRLALSGTISVLMIGAGIFFRAELPLKGAELLIGAAMHWLFFGTAE